MEFNDAFKHQDDILHQYIKEICFLFSAIKKIFSLDNDWAFQVCWPRANKYGILPVKF